MSCCNVVPVIVRRGPIGTVTPELTALVEQAENAADSALDSKADAEAAVIGSQVNYQSRGALVTAIAGGSVPLDGITYFAGGVAYVGTAGSTSIPDMPGLVYASWNIP